MERVQWPKLATFSDWTDKIVMLIYLFILVFNETYSFHLLKIYIY